MPFEKAIDLVEDLETQHMPQLGLDQMSASPPRPLASASEIRFVGLRNRMERYKGGRSYEKGLSGEIVEPKRFVFTGYRPSALSYYNSNAVRLTVRHLENPVGIDEHAVRSCEPT